MKAYIDVKDCIKLGARDLPAATIKLSNGLEYNIQFSRQKTGYGEKLFFVCPGCGCRRTKLYLCAGGLLCRECYPLPAYRGIKNSTPGGYDYIACRMLTLARQEGISLKFPFHYLEYRKPKYKHFAKWQEAIKKLQALENMRNQAIFFKKRYSLDTINRVYHNQHPLVSTCSLQELDKYFYRWE